MRTTLTFVMALTLTPGTLFAQETDEAGDARTSSGRSVDIAPYIEAAQVVSAELSPGDDIVTFSRVAAGVDATLTGRYSQAAVSVRYERRIGYDDTVSDTDTISGIARTSLALAGPDVTFEAGGLATRTRIDGNGGSTSGNFGFTDDSTSQIYSAYAGPAIRTQIGRAEVTGSYRLGYTRLEAPDAIVLDPASDPADIFDEAVTQNLALRAGFRPNTVLPIGVGIGGGWNRQDLSNLDQRVDDRNIRGDVTVPLSPNLALIGGVGYEDVEVSSRDAVRDENGDPVIGPDGRFATDDSAPRQLAFDTAGLIWDAGVQWRPSRRTQLQAQIGRRYGSTVYYGSLSYAPNANSQLSINAYDGLSSFGGQATSALSELGTDFSAFRNPVTGDLGGCVVGASSGDSCALARLGSVRSAAFRNRGVAISYSATAGRTSYGFGAGYDRRSFIAGENTVLAEADGLVDENYYLAGFASRSLDRQSQLSLGGSVNRFESGFDGANNSWGYSASLAYDRTILEGLGATAAVGIDGISRDDAEDFSNASALVGLRYTF